MDCSHHAPGDARSQSERFSSMQNKYALNNDRKDAHARGVRHHAERDDYNPRPFFLVH
jgi:hypothetical protein